MYLSLFNRRQASALLGLARELMASDGVESPEEEAFYQEMIRELDAHGVNHRMLTTRQAMLQAFETRQQRIIALLALLQLAYVDGTFSVEEISFVSRLAREMEISSELAARCESWALELMMLRAQGPALWGEEAAPTPERAPGRGA